MLYQETELDREINQFFISKNGYELPGGTCIYVREYACVIYRSDGVSLTIGIPEHRQVRNVIPEIQFHDISEDDYQMIEFDEQPEFERYYVFELA